MAYSKKHLKYLLIEDIEQCFLAMRDLNVSVDEKLFVLTYKRYLDVKKEYAIGTLRHEDYQIEISKISSNVLLIIESLDEDTIENVRLPVGDLFRIRKKILKLHGKILKFSLKHTNYGSKEYERKLLVYFENLLNNYDLVCILYLNKQINDELFIQIFKNEIIQIVEDLDQNLLRKLFNSGNSFRAVLDTYFLLVDKSK